MIFEYELKDTTKDLLLNVDSWKGNMSIILNLFDGKTNSYGERKKSGTQKYKLRSVI